MFYNSTMVRHAACLALAGLAAGCATSSTTGTGTGGRVTAYEKVVYVTGLQAFGREGYAWVAREKGFFREVGIDVEIQLGSAGDKNLTLVASGKAQFAVIDFAGAVVRAGNGEFGGFRLIGAVSQHTLTGIMTLAGGGINTPSDLVGKRVAVPAGSVLKTLFPAYATVAGFDSRRVQMIEQAPGHLPGLLATGRVDAIGQFVVGVPSVQRAAGGRPIKVLPYSDYLGDLYGNAVVISTSLLTDNPDLARRFTGALLKGLQYSIDHPLEAGQIMHRAVPATDAGVAAAELDLMGRYSRNPGGPIGAFDEGRVARSAAALASVGLIPPIADPPAFPRSMVDFTVVPATPRPSGTPR